MKSSYIILTLVLSFLLTAIDAHAQLRKPRGTATSTTTSTNTTVTVISNN